MRVVIDYRLAQYSRTGIGSYIHNLVHALSEISTIQLTLLSSANLTPVDGELATRVEVLPIAPTYGDYGRRELWEQFSLPRIVNDLTADVYHSPNYNLPFLFSSRAALVVTQFDASIFAVPQYYKWVHRAEGKFTFSRSAKVAHRIIFGSFHAQSEFQRFYPPSVMARSRVVHIALPDEFEGSCQFSDEFQWKTRVRFGVEEPYVIAIGSIHPRKNYERLIEALSSDEFGNLSLVICGSIAWKTRSFFEVLSRYRMERRVRVLGHVRTDELASLVAGAELLAFPSLYEGFGIPPLEAFRLCVPVCASGTSSIPEVVGDAAVLFDPLSVTNIREKIALTLNDKGLREELIKKGLERLRLFSWNRCALDHVAVYREAILQKENYP